jgi:hypothetical protein
VASCGLGAFGVAVSFVIVTAVSQLVYFWPLQLRLTGLGRQDFIKAVLVRGLLPAVVASAIWALLGTLFPPETWVSLIILSAIGSVA